jgi:hypothetical protein
MGTTQGTRLTLDYYSWYSIIWRLLLIKTESTQIHVLEYQPLSKTLYLQD